MKKNKGITLTALVITVVIMLILIGVTINMTVNRGFLSTSKQSRNETANSVKREQNGINDISAEFSTIDI